MAAGESPLNRPKDWQKLLGAVYDTMGEEFLRSGLRERGVPEDEIDQIVLDVSGKEEG